MISLIDRIQRLVQDGRVQAGLAIAAMFVAVFIFLASQYDETGIETTSGMRRVQTDGEHCSMILPDGWTWQAASWTAVSPRGTEVGFSESLYGWPRHVAWESEVQAFRSRYADRSDVTVTIDDDTLRVDFGPGGGLSVTQRFDRVGCHLTFSQSGGVRDEEFSTWQRLIESLERTSPTGTPRETPFV